MATATVSTQATLKLRNMYFETMPLQPPTTRMHEDADDQELSGFYATIHYRFAAHVVVLLQGEEAWQKVAVILAAIDRSLGIDLNVAISGTKRDGSTKVQYGVSGCSSLLACCTMIDSRRHVLADLLPRLFRTQSVDMHCYLIKGLRIRERVFFSLAQILWVVSYGIG